MMERELKLKNCSSEYKGDLYKMSHQYYKSPFSHNKQVFKKLDSEGLEINKYSKQFRYVENNLQRAW